ncbi:MAG: hypothetical protein M2R45_00245 [Verrucomicrobia subdivision 3 bacterium]|nr:hypothetical protein [Limisphaerales bacterium]MCS1412996.1 hypothetical protein [Limisphaerales bacterium]
MPASFATYDEVNAEKALQTIKWDKARKRDWRTAADYLNKLRTDSERELNEGRPEAPTGTPIMSNGSMKPPLPSEYRLRPKTKIGSVSASRKRRKRQGQDYRMLARSMEMERSWRQFLFDSPTGEEDICRSLFLGQNPRINRLWNLSNKSMVRDKSFR